MVLQNLKGTPNRETKIPQTHDEFGGAAASFNLSAIPPTHI
jgi:hypothetical protein